MARVTVDLTGLTIGRLTILEKAPPRYDGQGTRWVVRCQCGTVKEMRHNTLTSGKIVSCGCRAKEMQFRPSHPKPKQVNRPSGAPESKTETRTTDKIYNRWSWIRWHAGQNGIAFYPAWNDFDVFVSEVGRPPHEDYCLARQDKKRGWLPGNVAWQTTRKNTNKGAKPLKVNHARSDYVDRQTVKIVEDSSPALEWNGEKRTVNAWSRHLGIEPITLTRRLQRRPQPYAPLVTVYQRHAELIDTINHQRAVLTTQGYKPHAVLMSPDQYLMLVPSNVLVLETLHVIVDVSVNNVKVVPVPSQVAEYEAYLEEAA